MMGVFADLTGLVAVRTVVLHGLQARAGKTHHGGNGTLLRGGDGLEAVPKCL